MPATPVERVSALGDQVAEDLRRRIIVGELVTGELLVESRIAAHYSVSRGPVRDAIRTLVQEGLVDTPGRSARVVGLTAHDVDELFSIRAAIERLALTKAMQKYRAELVTLLEQALELMGEAVEAQDPGRFTRADMEFHSSFSRISGLRRVNDVWTQYQTNIENLLLVANLDHADLAPAMRKHVQLAEMIRDGNDAAALAELEAHLDASRRRVRRDYAGEPEPAGERP